MRSLSLLISGLMLLSLSVGSFAQVPPRTMSYQGLLTDDAGVPLPDDSYDMTFRIYIGDTAIWTESRAGIPVAGGRFSVILGEVNPIDVTFDGQYYLGITVAGSTELSPRVKLASAPSALMAADIVDNSITSAKVLNSSLTNVDLLDEAGIVYDEGGTANNLNEVPENLEWEDITIPAPGYVIAIGSAQVRISHRGQIPDQGPYVAEISVSTTSATHDNSNLRRINLPSLLPGSATNPVIYEFTVTVQDTFEFTSAGTHRIHLVGSSPYFASSSYVSSPENSILFIYVPKAYGYVNPLTSEEEPEVD